MDAVNEIWNSALVQLVRQLCILFWIIFHLALTFWTTRDASRRGGMAWFWGLTVFIFDIFAWMIYMVIRPPEYRDDVRERDLEIRAKEATLERDLETCPACHKAVEKDFLICPYCMRKLRKSCVECDKALKLNWSVCPYCKTKQ